MSEIRVFEGKVPEGGFPFYAWYVGKDDDDKKDSRQYFFACVSDEAFYLSRPLESSAKRIAESNRLQQEQPVDVFRTGQTVYFQTLGEVRCSKKGDRLELVRDDGQVVLGIDDVYSKQCRKMFDDIRRRRAPRMPVEEGNLSTYHSLNMALAVTGTAVVTTVSLCVTAYDAEPGRQFHGRRAIFREMWNEVAAKLTFPGAVGLSAIVVGVCLMWVIYRWVNPLPGDVVRLERR